MPILIAHFPPHAQIFHHVSPLSSPRKDRAVNLVLFLSGEFDARGAAEKVSLGPEAVQGIRKRVRSIRATEAKERAEEGHLRIVRTSLLRVFLAMLACFNGAFRRRPRARTPAIVPYLTCARHDSEHGD